MDFGIRTFTFKPGRWEWDDGVKGLVYVCDDTRTLYNYVRRHTTVPVLTQASERCELTFRDDISRNDELQFQRFFRRRCKLNEPDFVVLQDIKDVVLFTINREQLTANFIQFVHTPSVDRLLRALIIYFQFYFKVWNTLKQHSVDMKTMLMHPNVMEYQYSLRNDLSDLRAMVAREYCSMLTGDADTYKFYHMANKIHTSFMERDKRLYEMLLKFSTRIIWIALLKPNLFIIELEMNRLLRTDELSRHLFQTKNVNVVRFFEHGGNILRGGVYDATCRSCNQCQKCKLCKLSPLLNEIFADHDHRILSIGLVDFPPSDERLRFLEKAYLLPVEQLAEHGISVGILGMPRAKFDCMLKYIHEKRADGTMERLPQLHFDIPAVTPPSGEVLPNRYPSTRPRITPASDYAIRRKQCRLWLQRAARRSGDETMLFSLPSASKSVLRLKN